MSVIEVQNLKKYFKTAKTTTKAVDDISFTVNEGEVIGFLGPNGAGKTTTMNCLMDFLKPTDGIIKIFDQDVSKKSVEIKKQVGYLSSDVHLYREWTGREHIKFIEAIRGRSIKAHELVEEFGLNLNVKVKTLSNGNKQKLGVILAFMARPKLLILDEPTQGLDPLLQIKLYEQIDEFNKNGTTVFMSSHNLAEIERVCQKVCIIKKGKIVAFENLESMKSKKIYVVKASFKAKPGQSDLNDIKGSSSQIKIVDQYNNSYIFRVKGEINPIVKKLAKYDLAELTIEHATLEEIFLEFYK